MWSRLFRVRNLSVLTGVLLVLFSQIILIRIFYPVVAQEINYQLRSGNPPKPTPDPKTSPAHEGEIRIIIPKINVNEKVFPDIDPFNKSEYQKALKEGAAESSGSARPGQKGNIFIFAHSTDGPQDVSKYNAVFYLIYKLSPGDEVILTYQGKSYRYRVDAIKTINPNDVSSLNSPSKEQTLTLMTCWPPGTTLKRMLVESHLVK